MYKPRPPRPVDEMIMSVAHFEVGDGVISPDEHMDWKDYLCSYGYEDKLEKARGEVRAKYELTEDDTEILEKYPLDELTTNIFLKYAGQIDPTPENLYKEAFSVQGLLMQHFNQSGWVLETFAARRFLNAMIKLYHLTYTEKEKFSIVNIAAEGSIEDYEFYPDGNPKYYSYTETEGEGRGYSITRKYPSASEIIQGEKEIKAYFDKKEKEPVKVNEVPIEGPLSDNLIEDLKMRLKKLDGAELKRSQDEWAEHSKVCSKTRPIVNEYIPEGLTGGQGPCRCVH